MKSLFHAHREAFEKLRVASADLKGPMIFKSDIEGKNKKLNESEKIAFKNLFSEIDSDMVVGWNQDGTVRFTLARGALLSIGAGWLKGIEYIPKTDKRSWTIKDNLDNARTLPADLYFSPIEPEWYIFYERDE